MASISVWVVSNLHWQGVHETRSAGDLGDILAGSVVFHVALDQMASGLSRDEGQLPSEDRTSNHRGQEPRVRPRGFPVRAFDAE